MKDKFYGAGNLRNHSSAQAAGERFFRLYHKHTVAPDVDTLFNLLNAMHSLNDRLKKTMDRDFLDFDEFLTLKALRNLFHHEQELMHEVRIIPVQDLPPISTDLLFLCLLPSTLVHIAIEKIQERHRTRAAEATIRTLRWYGPIVNINPCLFNFSVRAFEMLQELGVQLTGAEHEAFDASYRAEEAAGQSHFVTGHIYCHATSVEELLAKAFSGSIKS